MDKLKIGQIITEPQEKDAIHMAVAPVVAGCGMRPGSHAGLDALAAAIYAGEHLTVGPNEDARDYIDNEWWNHWEIITGKRGERGEYFSCGC